MCEHCLNRLHPDANDLLMLQVAVYTVQYAALCQ
jgi:hypothetical protein